jgi:hypothetical protein
MIFILERGSEPQYCSLRSGPGCYIERSHRPGEPHVLLHGVDHKIWVHIDIEVDDIERK